MFTEVMSKAEWLKLMDYLFTFVWRQSTFLLAPIAILRAMRASILCVTSDVHLQKYFQSQQGVYASDVIKLILTMEELTPGHLFSAVIGNSGNPKRNGLEQRRENKSIESKVGTGKGKKKEKSSDFFSQEWDEEEELANMNLDEFER